MPTEQHVWESGPEEPGTLRIGIADGQVVYVQIENSVTRSTVAVSLADFEDLLERAGFGKYATPAEAKKRLMDGGRIDVV